MGSTDHGIRLIDGPSAAQDLDKCPQSRRSAPKSSQPASRSALLASSMDDQSKVGEMSAALGVGAAVSSFLFARVLLTPSDLAFSIPDAESLECFIKAVLRDGPAPEGEALQNPQMPDGALKIHKESGKLRRLYSECKK